MPYKNMRDRLDHQNERRKQYIEKIQNYKKEIGACHECGWNIHPQILEFDHLIKENKRFDFSVGCLGNYSWKTVLKEIKKCRLICPNCHRWKHFNEKEWFKTRRHK